MAKVATPTFNPPGGIYTSPVEVTINCVTPGASIYYTIDGSDPDENSTLYVPGYPIVIGPSYFEKETIFDWILDYPYTIEPTVLIHSDDADGSQVFVDSSPSPKTIITSTAEHDTAKAVFGASSISAANGYIAFAANQSAFNLSNNDFTFSLWCYHSGINAERQVFGLTNLNGASDYYFYLDTTGALATFSFYDTDSVLHTATISIATSYGADWHHFAFTRSGNYMYAFQDGILYDTVDITGKTVQYNSGRWFSLGRGQTTSFKFKGWIDEFLFINGYGLWTENFDVQTDIWSY